MVFSLKTGGDYMSFWYQNHYICVISVVEFQTSISGTLPSTTNLPSVAF